MEIIETVGSMKTRIAAWKAAGLTVGLVPTMGSLHAGHESLMDAARAACDRVVGTSPTVSPAAFQAAIRVFMDPTVSMISMVASYRFSSTPAGAA